MWVQILNGKIMLTVLNMPSMKQINTSKKLYTAVSTFSGCGGSSTGYKMAGFDVLFANEFVPAAQDTYRENHKSTFLDCSDIRELKPQFILKTLGIKKGDLDLFDASPPCKSFSNAGKKEAGWGSDAHYSDGITQRTDDLFYEACRILKGLMPKTFVMENVEGLVQGSARGYFIEIYKALEKCGYNVAAAVTDASQLGVPQARRRLIFIGVRNDLKMQPKHPKPLSRIITVRDVLPHVAYIKSKKNGILKYVPSDIPSPTITASDKNNSETAGFSSGGFIETVDGTRRKYSIQELKKICAFPDDFILTGSYEQQFERLGRAVPPVMMYHIAKSVIDNILKPYYGD